MASLSAARRVVVKIGSALLVDAASGALRAEWLRTLAEDVARLKRRGADVVLVSSGSIALGRAVLGLAPGALPLEQSQAAAAVGQIRLARAYEEVLAPHGLTAAQVLLTLEDSANRRRYLNSRATLAQLLAFGAVPIVNENDTVATDEIRYGDNDRLAAQIAVTVGADVLVLLSDVDGFYTANPREDPGARRLEVIERITPEIEAMAGDAGTGLSKGGMKTKLMAARTATRAGCAMVIAAGARPHPLRALEDGAPCTWFAAQDDPQAARKRWIAAMKPRGEIVVDAGAEAALRHGKSLLPAGVVSVSGRFGRGDPVAIVGPSGRIGVGLARYTAEEARAIAGHRSAEIEAVLGYPGRASLVHRDDMVVDLPAEAGSGAETGAARPA
ncbi:glutamate 5-kinase [Meinhardsimonia xiamenensis]|uniref:Glutamate 5-kinase n=1 Tax=Meinhardsimonia xiamenensis TaxID=990712 RepID=A0A1G9FX09_9RHOB|nr:glutamate 5-kinase [Meinhardsimonia xiamenensis]PRX32768.1 glutamate 5-kinase [Meinhardsimonia xiamenensis]SDK92986.1 glutamate 5-kinase [Meinhardsimonia xiamenensis]